MCSWSVGPTRSCGHLRGQGPQTSSVHSRFQPAASPEPGPSQGCRSQACWRAGQGRGCLGIQRNPQGLQRPLGGVAVRRPEGPSLSVGPTSGPSYARAPPPHPHDRPSRQDPRSAPCRPPLGWTGCGLGPSWPSPGPWAAREPDPKWAGGPVGRGCTRHLGSLRLLSSLTPASRRRRGAWRLRGRSGFGLSLPTGIAGPHVRAACWALGPGSEPAAAPGCGQSRWEGPALGTVGHGPAA